MKTPATRVDQDITRVTSSPVLGDTTPAHIGYAFAMSHSDFALHPIVNARNPQHFSESELFVATDESPHTLSLVHPSSSGGNSLSSGGKSLVPALFEDDLATSWSMNTVFSR